MVIKAKSLNRPQLHLRHIAAIADAVAAAENFPALAVQRFREAAHLDLPLADQITPAGQCQSAAGLQTMQRLPFSLERPFGRKL